MANMPSPSLFVHSWVSATQHILFPCMPSTIYGFMSKIIARKTKPIKGILLIEVTFSFEDLSLRRKGPLLALHAPSMPSCIVVMCSSLQLPSPLLMYYRLLLLSLLLFLSFSCYFCCCCPKNSFPMLLLEP